MSSIKEDSTSNIKDPSISDDDSSQSKKVRLERRLELHHGVAIVCGLIMGMGIFVTPAGVTQGAGSGGLTLILWLIGGIIALVGSLTFAELGTTFPSSGEKYVYLQKMYSPFVGYLYLWIYLCFYRCGANAVKMITISQFLLHPIFGESIPRPVTYLIAFIFVYLFGFINCLTVKGSARLQTTVASCNCLALITIIVSGIVALATGRAGDWSNISFENTNTNLGDILVGLYSAIYALGGWNGLNFMVEELKNPKRNLPLSIAISITIVITLYLMVNVSYLVILGPEAMSNSKGVAMTYSTKTLGSAMFVMSLLVCINLLGSYNSGILIGSRLGFVGAREGHMPPIIGLIQTKRRTPITSVIFQTLLISVMCFVDVFSLINNLTFAHNIFDLLTVIGMIRFRIKKPDLSRPIKFPLIIPWIYCVSMGILVVFPLVLKPQKTAVGVAIGLFTGIPYYLLFVKRIIHIQALDNISEFMIKLTQKLLICLPEE